MKTLLLKFSSLIIVSLLAIVFFVATSSFNYITQDQNYVKWSSPDETANYFFSKRFAETKELAIFDPAAIVGDNMVMPRSLRSDFGWLKPVSFLGIVLTYGTIASWLGVVVIPFLTPFFAALGIIIFYLLIRRLFSSRVALLSAFLLASFPVYIYYSVRSLFHNVLFIVLLLIGFYLIVLALGDRKEKIKQKFISFSIKLPTWLSWVLAFLAGLFTGLAVITRTSELLWLLPSFIIIWLFYARRLGVGKLVLFLAGLIIACLPVLYWNKVLYNAFLHGGYNEMNRSLDEISSASGELVKLTWRGQLESYRVYLEKIGQQIFYFGFNARQSMAMFKHYVVDMFPWLLYLGLGGWFILLGQNIRHFQKKYLVYTLVGVILGAILVFYYGSWLFNDNPDPNRFTIGNSYTRYWLPIYLMLMPLAALAIIQVSRAVCFIGSQAKNRIKLLLASGLQAVVVLIIMASSLIFVLYGSEEGLAYLYYNNKLEKISVEKVLSLTEPESIIITRYYDKFFFPERRVIMGTIPDQELLTAVGKLSQYYPIYYYNFHLNEADVVYLNNRKLPEYNLEMEIIKKINSNFGLYQLHYHPYGQD